MQKQALLYCSSSRCQCCHQYCRPALTRPCFWPSRWRCTLQSLQSTQLAKHKTHPLRRRVPVQHRCTQRQHALMQSCLAHCTWLALQPRMVMHTIFQTAGLATAMICAGPAPIAPLHAAPARTDASLRPAVLDRWLRDSKAKRRLAVCRPCSRNQASGHIHCSNM